ncbi:MAG: DNA-directed RNA polymerase subunit omega [Treponema sp.]|nr:DNA-directed RNA polymerase subunit omega [Treponema sp.]
MIFPLEELAKFKGGMYGITVAASRRAFQLAKLAMYKEPEIAEEVEENDGKVVSLAARQLFSGDVKYSIESQATID